MSNPTPPFSASPLVPRSTSSPAPPTRTSWPLPPDRLSLPAPPSTRSSSAPPTKVSLPAFPTKVAPPARTRASKTEPSPAIADRMPANRFWGRRAPPRKPVTVSSVTPPATLTRIVGAARRHSLAVIGEGVRVRDEADLETGLADREGVGRAGDDRTSGQVARERGGDARHACDGDVGHGVRPSDARSCCTERRAITIGRGTAACSGTRGRPYGRSLSGRRAGHVILRPEGRRARDGRRMRPPGRRTAGRDGSYPWDVS